MKNQFSSKKEALEFLNSAEGFFPHNTNPNKFSPSGTYYLSHGEYSQPDYTVRRYKDGWAIHVEYFFYAGTFNAPSDGRLDDDKFEYLFLLN